MPLIKDAREKGRMIHFLPPYRGETILWLSDLMNLDHLKLREHASIELIKGVIKLRMVKDDLEIKEIEKMIDVAWLMHTNGHEDGETRGG